jgi:transcription antitermination factor NusG
MAKLDALDVAVFYPMRAVWRKQRSGPRIRKEYPLIPSYLFVEVDLNDTSARSILSIDGIISFLGINGVPSVVDEDQLTFMRVCEREGHYDETLARAAKFIVGQTVAINDGAFAGLNGVVKSVTTDDVYLDITILGRTTVLKIDVDNAAVPL